MVLSEIGVFWLWLVPVTHVPTVRFAVLFDFIVPRHERRRNVHFGITTLLTAPWVAQQLWEAFPTVPRHLIRDRDDVYGSAFRATAAVMGIEDVMIAPRSPWQNPYVERVIAINTGRAGYDVLAGAQGPRHVRN